MQINIKTEKKYIWLLSYCLILASVVEVYTHNFLVIAGIVVGNEVITTPIVYYGGTIFIACFGCLILVRMYDLCKNEKEKKNVMAIGVLVVSFVVLFCIINLWRLLVCMY